MLVFGLLVFVCPFSLEACPLKMSLLAAEFTGCTISWALVTRMNIFLTPDTGFLSICLAVCIWLRFKEPMKWEMVAADLKGFSGWGGVMFSFLEYLFSF